jgi:ABC-2 type transport system ATP-binding protein
MQSDVVIECNKLSKRYDAKLPYALKSLNIKVNKGDIYGFLGPNGAGKSTTIRTLLNFLQPSEGSATIFGKDIVRESVQIKKSIGYLSGDFTAYDKMTTKQFLSYMSEIQPNKNKSYYKELISLFKPNVNKKIGELSKGNKQKLGIIQACMHQPDLLILDEPTDGLDPLMQETFYTLVKKLSSKGVTIFVSSHNLAEVKKICNRIGIIKDGKLVSEHNISDLKNEVAQTFNVSFESGVSSAEIKKVTGVKKVSSTGNNTFVIHVHGNLSPLLLFLSKQKINSLSSKELDLEEEFMKYYETDGKR